MSPHFLTVLNNELATIASHENLYQDETQPIRDQFTPELLTLLQLHYEMLISFLARLNSGVGDHQPQYIVTKGGRTKNAN